MNCPRLLEWVSMITVLREMMATKIDYPNLTPASLLMSSSRSLEDVEEWYRQKHPNIPEEYYGSHG